MRSIEWSLTAGIYVSRLPIPSCLVTSKPLICSICAYSSATVFDSGKSAEPTISVFRSPERGPPPRGLALPQPLKKIAAMTATSSCAALRIPRQ
ncbi:Uncharacterised protein [Mycobacteroides abscessus subsp. abscessus]|nr:Uncharacterised protein [Mycobacteroides abscessus subsp. abscessus]